MKIVCQYSACGPSFVRDGWRKIFQVMGHEFYWWLPEAKSAFDIFDEIQPDIFIGTTFDFDRALYKCIVNRPNTKVALYCSAWGDLIKGIDTKKYPLIVINDKEKKLLENLKKETGRPDFVFLHYPESWVDRTLGGWRTIGIEPVSMLNASDTFDYTFGEFKPELAADISFVGGYWEYKARNLDQYIVPLCDFFQKKVINKKTNKLRIRIYGNQPWNTPQYLGFVDNYLVKHIFASSIICPSISEPHSTDFGFDIIERPFKVLTSGGFCISDYVEGIRELFSEKELIMVKSPEEFWTTCQYYLDNPQETFEFINNGQKAVLLQHTYWHRVADMFTHFGMQEESMRTVAQYAEYLKQIGMNDILNVKGVVDE